MLTADPRVVPTARNIACMSYDDALAAMPVLTGV